MSDRLFDRVALIGIGLIGSSLARVLRRDSPRDAHRRLRPPRRDAGRRCAASASPTRRPTIRPRRCADADLVVLATPLSAYAEIGRQIAPALRDGRDRHRCRLGQGGGDPRPAARMCRRGVHFVPGHPVAGTEHSGPEAGLRRAVPRPLVHPDAAARHRSRRRSPRSARMWEAAGMRVVTMARRAPRQGAGDDLASAASDRLHDRRHRDRTRARDLQIRGHRVLGRRLSRLHPHRRLRPGDVARHLSRTTARPCSKCCSASARI